jgi:hypothetical protein
MQNKDHHLYSPCKTNVKGFLACSIRALGRKAGVPAAVISAVAGSKTLAKIAVLAQQGDIFCANFLE